MLENLPWIIAGLVVGLFVGYAFGKYKGASVASEALESEPAKGQAGGEDAPSSQSDAESKTRVYIRRGGSHYHKDGCRHLRGRGHLVTKAAATKKGYRRCPSCRP